MSDNDPDLDLHWWIKALTLYEDDKEILLGDKEVTDGIINAVQSLLSVQFQHIAGFQDTILGHNLNFKSVDPNVSSVQILHTGTCICTCIGACTYMIVHVDVSIEIIHGGELCQYRVLYANTHMYMCISVDFKYA